MVVNIIPALDYSVKLRRGVKKAKALTQND